MNTEEGRGVPQMNTSVSLTGTAKEGAIGPPFGMVDIGTTEDAFFFRVALPGAKTKEPKLKCAIEPDGTVCIQGEVSDGELLKNSSMAYEMKVQQLCPTGPFTVSFNLPGPVEPKLSYPYFSDGIMEVAVMRYRKPSFSAEGWINGWFDGMLHL